MSLQVAVVGVGNIGNIHARVYHEHPGTTLVAVCDAIRAKADQAAEKYGCQAFYSVRDMLDSGLRLDACSVATKGEENGGEHFAPTMELLAAGIPVLAEKPISNKLEEAERMVQTAHEGRIPFAVNLNHRFTPAAKRAKEWVQSGRLGQLHMINMRMWINNQAETSPWFHLRALHPHSFDVIRYFAGDIDRVAAFMMKGEGRTIWSNAQVLLHFKNGMIGNLVGSYDAGAGYGLEQCEVVGSKGRFVLTDACERLAFYARHSIETETFDYLGGMRSFNETFKSRISSWIDQLTAHTPWDQIDGSGEDALRAQRVIEAAIESWNTGRIIEL